MLWWTRLRMPGRMLLGSEPPDRQPPDAVLPDHRVRQFDDWVAAGIG